MLFRSITKFLLDCTHVRFSRFYNRLHGKMSMLDNSQGNFASWREALFEQVSQLKYGEHALRLITSSSSGRIPQWARRIPLCRSKGAFPRIQSRSSRHQRLTTTTDHSNPLAVRTDWSST